MVGIPVKYRVVGSKCVYLQELLKEKWSFFVKLPTFTRASELEKGYQQLEVASKMPEHLKAI